MLSIDDIRLRVPYFSNYLEPNDFNNLYSEFLRSLFNYELAELLPTIQYLADFFNMQFDYSDFPFTPKTFGDYCSL